MVDANWIVAEGVCVTMYGGSDWVVKVSVPVGTILCGAIDEASVIGPVVLVGVSVDAKIAAGVGVGAVSESVTFV
jgi:hypothetical protein